MRVSLVIVTFILLNCNLAFSQKPNKIAFRFLYDYYEEPWLQQRVITGIAYHHTSDMGTVIGRWNFSDFILENESFLEKEVSQQLELTAYPKFSEKAYGYFNYGYSPDPLFPLHRSGIELFHALPMDFEASLGGRFLYINNPQNSREIIAYTGYIGKYYGNFWFAFRPFFTEGPHGLAESYNVETRYYFNNGKNYVSVQAGSGLVPDNPLNYQDPVSRNDLKKNHIAAGFKGFISKSFELELRAAYRRDQYQSGKYRDALRGNVSIGYVF